jgi:cysteine sulfinate desulfinase/cysteine desulfurase-like protein
MKQSHDFGKDKEIRDREIRDKGSVFASGGTERSNLIILEKIKRKRDRR